MAGPLSTRRDRLPLARPAVHTIRPHRPLVMGKFGVTEIVLILLVVLLLFGGRKIPELMRGLGKGMREFKDAQKGEPDRSEEKP